MASFNILGYFHYRKCVRAIKKVCAQMTKLYGDDTSNWPTEHLQQLLDEYNLGITVGKDGEE